MSSWLKNLLIRKERNVCPDVHQIPNDNKEILDEQMLRRPQQKNSQNKNQKSKNLQSTKFKWQLQNKQKFQKNSSFQVLWPENFEKSENFSDAVQDNDLTLSEIKQFLQKTEQDNGQTELSTQLQTSNFSTTMQNLEQPNLQNISKKFESFNSNSIDTSSTSSPQLNMSELFICSNHCDTSNLKTPRNIENLQMEKLFWDNSQKVFEDQFEITNRSLSCPGKRKKQTLLRRKFWVQFKRSLSVSFIQQRFCQKPPPDLQTYQNCEDFILRLPGGYSALQLTNNNLENLKRNNLMNVTELLIFRSRLKQILKLGFQQICFAWPIQFAKFTEDHKLAILKSLQNIIMKQTQLIVISSLKVLRKIEDAKLHQSCNILFRVLEKFKLQFQITCAWDCDSSSHDCYFEEQPEINIIQNDDNFLYDLNSPQRVDSDSIFDEFDEQKFFSMHKHDSQSFYENDCFWQSQIENKEKLNFLKGWVSDFNLPEKFQLYRLEQIVCELQSLEFGSCSIDMYACLHKMHALIRHSLCVDGFASADDITQCVIHGVIQSKLKYLATIAQFLEFSNLMEDYFSQDAQVLCNLQLAIAFIELKMRSSYDQSKTTDFPVQNYINCDMFLQKYRDMYSFLVDWLDENKQDNIN